MRLSSRTANGRRFNVAPLANRWSLHIAHQCCHVRLEEEATRGAARPSGSKVPGQAPRLAKNWAHHEHGHARAGRGVRSDGRSYCDRKRAFVSYHVRCVYYASISREVGCRQVIPPPVHDRKDDEQRALKANGRQVVMFHVLLKKVLISSSVVKRHGERFSGRSLSFGLRRQFESTHGRSHLVQGAGLIVFRLISACRASGEPNTDGERTSLQVAAYAATNHHWRPRDVMQHSGRL